MNEHLSNFNDYFKNQKEKRCTLISDKIRKFN